MIQEAATQMDGIDFSVINDISYISVFQKAAGFLGNYKYRCLIIDIITTYEAKHSCKDF